VLMLNIFRADPARSMFEGSTTHEPPQQPVASTSQLPPAPHQTDSLTTEAEAAFAVHARRPSGGPSRSRSVSPSTSPPPSFTQGSPASRAKDARRLEPGLHLGGRGVSDSVSYEAVQGGLSRKDRALWRWVNVEDLDVFLMEVRDCARSRHEAEDQSRSTRTTSVKASGVSPFRAYSTSCAWLAMTLSERAPSLTKDRRICHRLLHLPARLHRLLRLATP
jgi:hypothetical protein